MVWVEQKSGNFKGYAYYENDDGSLKFGSLPNPCIVLVSCIGIGWYVDNVSEDSPHESQVVFTENVGERFDSKELAMTLVESQECWAV